MGAILTNLHRVNALVFSMKHPQDQEIQICSNEVPEVTYGHVLSGHNLI